MKTLFYIKYLKECLVCFNSENGGELLGDSVVFTQEKLLKSQEEKVLIGAYISRAEAGHVLFYIGTMASDIIRQTLATSLNAFYLGRFEHARAKRAQLLTLRPRVSFFRTNNNNKNVEQRKRFQILG